MYDLIDSTALADMIRQYFTALVDVSFGRGMLVGSVLGLLEYGIFKAVSLLNIKD